MASQERNSRRLSQQLSLSFENASLGDRFNSHEIIARQGINSIDTYEIFEVNVDFQTERFFSEYLLDKF